ncbi:hypothetical protein BGZ72_005079 [Mortierella alpina]|nr:hypothetical protein BGZ72_005079 [Mortierella alpina]
MAKKKTSTRKARQTAQATHSPYAARSSSTVSNSPSASKAASAAPSNASSPSPQLADPVQVGRRKSMPRRSPSQNDPSQGIVFSFVFQKDPALSMSVDIRSYDQQFGPSEEQAAEGTAPAPAGAADLVAATAVTSSAAGAPTPLAMSHADNSPSVSSHASSSTAPSSSASPSLRMAGEQWSSDPSAFRSSNVYDESRNLLILHTRRPAPVIAVAPSTAPSTQPLSSPFTPALSQSGSSSFSASPSASSSASPSTPSPPFQSALATPGSCSQAAATAAAAATTGDSLCGRKPLPLDIISSQPTRYLHVRGLGGANRGRRMQVILVS